MVANELTVDVARLEPVFLPGDTVRAR